MSLELDLITAAGVRRVSLTAERWSIGNSAENDITLETDPTVSQLHASLERFAAGWLLSDLGSSNGTWLNGERILTPRRLRNGDEIRVGTVRLLVRSTGMATAVLTETDAGPPTLTTREREVLVCLCRPMLDRDMFTEPASTRVIAEELVVTVPAVKQHLTNLYVKFGVAADEPNRRVRLANEALRRGAVSLSELRSRDS